MDGVSDGGDVGSDFVWWWYWGCLGLSVILYMGCQSGDVGSDAYAISVYVGAVGSVFALSCCWGCS